MVDCLDFDSIFDDFRIIQRSHPVHRNVYFAKLILVVKFSHHFITFEIRDILTVTFWQINKIEDGIMRVRRLHFFPGSVKLRESTGRAGGLPKGS